MRLSRLALVGLVLGAAKVSAVLGLLVAVPCILVAFLVAGWSFRLMVFGLVWSIDFLLGRDEAPGRRRRALAFATDGADGVPARTLGRVTWRDGRAELRYRPWLVLPARTDGRCPTPTGSAAGLTGPVLLAREGHHAGVLVRFPPRYRRRAGRAGRGAGRPARWSTCRSSARSGPPGAGSGARSRSAGRRGRAARPGASALSRRWRAPRRPGGAPAPP